MMCILQDTIKVFDVLVTYALIFFFFFYFLPFKGESITFRATTAGVLTTLQHCLEIIAENDETWKKKVDREVEKRKKVEEQNRKFKEEIEKLKRISYPGPDLEVCL